MKFCVLPTTDPYYNLAVEEYLFNTSKTDVFLLWQNSNTVVIGKNQNAYAEIDFNVLEEHCVKLARRITGGGAVYHDLGNVNYSFISPNASTNGIDFGYYVKPVIAALSTLGVNVTLSGRNDLVTSDGKKISGNAQHRVKDRVLHHGTLLFDSDLEFLSKVLTVDREKLISKAVKSTRSRVENISALTDKKINVKEFIEYLAKYIIQNYAPEVITLPNDEEISRLYERNKSIGWLYPEKSFISDYEKKYGKRYEFGRVEVYLKLKNAVVNSLKIRGDFFGEKPIEELERMFSGVPLCDLESILQGVSVSSYILGMQNSEFLRLLGGKI